MKKRTLTESEVLTITNGLRVAAERFHGHAEDCMKDSEGKPGLVSLGRQFEKQRDESRVLADFLEGAESVEVLGGHPANCGCIACVVPDEEDRTPRWNESECLGSMD